MNPYRLLQRVGPLSLLLGSFVLMAGGLSLPGLVPGAIAFAILLLAAALLAGPGRVDWPPISSMPAPSSIMRSACCTAASVVAWRPPS